MQIGDVLGDERAAGVVPGAGADAIAGIDRRLAVGRGGAQSTRATCDLRRRDVAACCALCAVRVSAGESAVVRAVAFADAGDEERRRVGRSAAARPGRRVGPAVLRSGRRRLPAGGCCGACANATSDPIAANVIAAKTILGMVISSGPQALGLEPRNVPGGIGSGMRKPCLLLCLRSCSSPSRRSRSGSRDPRNQPGAPSLFPAPEQHDLYDGHFVPVGQSHLHGGRPRTIPLAGITWTTPRKTVRPASGTVEIDVDEIKNTGTFEARLKIPEGDLVLAIDRFNEFNPCQNGGIVASLHEHGTDSGCGDNNWPKTFVYLAGWGFGHATLNGKPLYDNYEMHFMVTQGIRDRKTLKVNYPMANKKRPGGRSEPGGAANRLLHPQPAAEPEEQAESRGVHALLRDGGHLEVI